MNSGGGPVAPRTAARTAGSRWALWTAIAVLVGLGFLWIWLSMLREAGWGDAS